MKIELQKATLIKRYKRFLADVILPDGTTTTIYVSNTGAMTGCAEAGDTIWYSTSTDPKRKYSFSWELTQTQNNHLICVNTARSNQLAAEAINDGTIKELYGYSSVKREVKYGEENSRIDFLLSGENIADCYVEVKSCTLLENEQGFFPDTITTRGQKHLRELIQMKKQGYRSVLLFTVLHSGITSVMPAQHIDLKYAQLFELAKAQGVEIIAYSANISIGSIKLSMPLKVKPF